MAIPCVRDQSFIEHSRTFIARERTWLANRLMAIPGLRVFPSAANFLLLRVTARGLDARTFRQRGEEALILVRECSNFAGLGKQFFRVAIRTRREHQQLLALCEAVFGKGEEKRH
jgi:threonine-phosphate decarboxylase